MSYSLTELFYVSNDPGLCTCKGFGNTEHYLMKDITISIIGWMALSVPAAWGDVQPVILLELVTGDLSTWFSKAQSPPSLQPRFPSEEIKGGILSSSSELNPNPRRRRCAKALIYFANAFSQVLWPAPNAGNEPWPTSTSHLLQL